LSHIFDWIIFEGKRKSKTDNRRLVNPGSFFITDSEIEVIKIMKNIIENRDFLTRNTGIAKLNFFLQIAVFDLVSAQILAPDLNQSNGSVPVPI